jgi:hypothetical protein
MQVTRPALGPERLPTVQDRPAPEAAAEPAAIPNGMAASAILAAALGCFALGLVTVLSPTGSAFSNLLTLYAPVGPLSGKTTAAVMLWLFAWGGLNRLWRHRNVNFSLVFGLALVLIGLGLVGTFPPFVAFAAEWIAPT